MRRDSVTLEVADVSWFTEDDEPRRPRLLVHVEDDDTAVRERLLRGGDPPDAGDLDVTFRFQDGPEAPDADGVLSITDRITGEFLIEVNAGAALLEEFVTAARRYAERSGDPTRYRASVEDDGGSLLDVEKRTLLVYSGDGELLRQHSLIPSGVEI